MSSSNTDEVIQKRLLRKTPEAEIELRAAWEKSGDILRNQITFDRSGPTLKNFDGAESFVANYPFAPYHFQLVQKVFEEIRKVGATGAHLAYGERSMLDAFQMAAMSLADKDIGALVPMYAFYRSVEGFLDTAVKRTIDQASENTSLDTFDVQILRTLFMIRYVELIKGTLDNLVTLSIEKIDEDKLALRRRIEETLQRLEKESLITRNGDEFVFLTNEGRDITRKIKATDIASSDENKELASLIYKDLLKDKNKYRYHVNKTDYSIGRYLDGHTLDGRYESDLRVEIVSPLDLDYAQYSEAGCINESTDGAAGQAVIKLPDDKIFFQELRTWLKTNKFIRLNDDGNNTDLSRILADRGRENQERRKRLRHTLEDMLLRAECYALGQHLQLSTSSRPHDWPDGEILLILGRLAATGRISFHTGGPSKPLNDVFEYLNNSRRRREISVQKKRQTDDAILKKTRNLSRDLFNALGPDTEKELFDFYCSHFDQWLTNLRSYKSKTDVGRFPGKQVIESAILTLERLMANRESFDFFKTVIDNKNDYLELEEDYRDIHEFFSNQLHSWQQLQRALNHFEKNQQALQKNDSASKALAKLKHIDKAEAPYGLLHKVVSLVETVEAVNTAIVREKREHALMRVEEKIQQLQAEIIKSGIATADLSNRLLRPLQLIKEDLTGETSIATIYMLQTQTAQEKLDDSLFNLEQAAHAEAEKQAKARRDAQDGAGTYTHKTSQDASPTPTPAPVAMPKPVVDVSAAKVFSKLASGIYLEKQEDVDKFVAALKEELQKAIKEGGRVRLK